MRFDDKYKKAMNQKSLSEEFIQDLCMKMTEKANQTDSEISTKSTENNESHTLETQAIEYTAKTRTKKYYPYMIAAAAAFLLICSAAVKNILDKDNIINPDEIVTPPPPAVVAETSAVSVTPKISNVSVVTKISEVPAVVNTPVTTYLQNQEISEPTAQIPQRNDDGSFSSADALINYISTRKAEKSPIAIGYKRAGTADLFSDFYDVSCYDTSYSYKIKNQNIFKSALVPYEKYDETGTVSQIDSSLSSEDLEQFSRIFRQIDKEAGQENYYIYDVYKFNYHLNALSEYEGELTSPECDNYRVEIVLKDYYNEYLENPCRDNVVLSYEVRNDLDYNSDLTSEYNYFINEENKAKEFYSEFTEQFTDCAITIGNIDTEAYGYKIYRPYTTWFRPSSGTSDEDYRSHLAQLYNSCYLPETESYYNSVTLVNIDACLFFKPGTNPDDIKPKLEEMKSIFQKYNVLEVTVDILNSDSDYNAYKSGNGFGDSDVVDSSYRKYYDTYYNDFSEWIVR